MTDSKYDYYPLNLKKAMLWKNKNKPSNISVTMIAAPCLKQSYLKLSEGSAIDEEGLLTLFIGTSIHKALEGEMTWAEMFLEWKTDIAKCVGFLDGIILDRQGAKLIDWKTVTYASSKVKNPPDVWVKSYELQLRIYAQMLKKQHYVIKEAELVFIGLADKKVVIRSVDILQDISKLIDERTNTLAMALASKVSPIGIVSDACKFCQWKDTCEEFQTSQKTQSVLEPNGDAIRGEI
jgi:hypothetical protein